MSNSIELWAEDHRFLRHLDVQGKNQGTVCVNDRDGTCMQSRAILYDASMFILSMQFTGVTQNLDCCIVLRDAYVGRGLLNLPIFPAL